MAFRTLIFILFSVAVAAAQNEAVELFEKKVRPILAERCYMCHSVAAPAVQGGLRLDSVQGIRSGGNSGALINTQDPERSLLLRALRYTDKNLKMPPGMPLPPEEHAEIEAWVKSGAPMPGEPSATGGGNKSSALWSLQKPVAGRVPEVERRGWVKNEIDRFVLHRLEAKGLAPSPEADKRTLIRRAYYDLTGLPPSAKEAAAFVQNNSAAAYEALVDRLLASPQYGERWGRHWLDVARYADSAVNAVNQARRYAWSYTYRDWVIRSLNEDLPYDRFLLYQLAADRVPQADKRHLAALGFLSLGREFPNNIHETVDDRIDAVTRGMMGLTVACARCHDHKYDPISTQDYYSLYGILANIREPSELPLLKASAPLSGKDRVYLRRLEHFRDQLREYRSRRHTERIAFFKTQMAEYLLAARDAERMTYTELEEVVRDRQLNHLMLSRWRDYLRESKVSGEPVFSLWHRASELSDWPGGWASILASAPNANPVVVAELMEHSAASMKELAARYAALLERYDREQPFAQSPQGQLRAVMRGRKSPFAVPLDEFERIFSEGDSNNTRAIKLRYGVVRAQYAYDGGAPRAMAIEDVPRPVPAHVFVRGNPNNPGAATPPRFLSCLAGPELTPFRDGNARLELARAIIDPANPLTARVMVNRVWMHHFGAGLMRTPSDFGARGDPPTHPELLDFLAVKFVESGWSLKKLHRMIMLSATYRQASFDNETGRKLDPENLLLWRMNRRRLDIESLRDSMLAAAGRVDLRGGGAPFLLAARPSVPRRSVYGFIERGRIPGLLANFDFASPDQHAPMRFVTTVPQQALLFLNSPFVLEQATALAERSKNAKGDDDPAERIRRLYGYVYGRAPEAREVAAGTRFIEAASQESAAPAAPAANPWRYGTGLFDSASGKVISFEEFPVFGADAWQGAAVLPAARSGKAVVDAEGGKPGDLPHQAVVRRWTSPVTGAITIEGTLEHDQDVVPFGDGVRGRIVSSRRGELASWSLNGVSAEARLAGLKVEKGETIDFIVDARSDPENDEFTWAPVIKFKGTVWDAKNDFRGPAPQPAGPWVRYAQVLLETNEFAFVD